VLDLWFDELTDRRARPAGRKNPRWRAMPDGPRGSDEFEYIELRRCQFLEMAGFKWELIALA
jgi:hypothetical protein